MLRERRIIYCLKKKNHTHPFAVCTVLITLGNKGTEFIARLKPF